MEDEAAQFLEERNKSKDHTLLSLLCKYFLIPVLR